MAVPEQQPGRSAVSRQGLLRAWGVLVTGDVLAKALGVATVILVSRMLDVRQFGTYSFAVAYGSSFSFFTDLGLDAATTRELSARGPEEEGVVLGSALILKVGLVLVASAVAIGTLFAFPGPLRLAAAVALITLLASVPGTPALLLNARIKVVGATLIQLAGAAVTLGGTVAILHYRRSPTGAVAVATGVAVVSGVALAALSRRAAVAPLEIRSSMVRLIGAGAAPIGLSMIGVVVYRRADQLLLGAFHRISDLAQYAAAVRLVDALNILPLAVATLALPILSRVGAGQGDRDAAGTDREERMAAVGYRLLAAVVLPVAALASYEGYWLMGAIFGRSFRAAGTALAILLWAHYFGFTGVLVDQVLIARRQSRYLAALTLAGAAINLGANLWAIPQFGKIGAAYTSLAAYAAPFVLGSFVPTVRAVFRACLANSVRPAIAALILIVLLEGLGPDPRVGVIVFAAAVVPVLLVTGSVRVQEVRDILSAVLSRSRRSPTTLP